MPTTIDAVSETLQKQYTGFIGIKQFQHTPELVASYHGVRICIDPFKIRKGASDWPEYVYAAFANKLDMINEHLAEAIAKTQEIVNNAPV